MTEILDNVRSYLEANGVRIAGQLLVAGAILFAGYVVARLGARLARRSLTSNGDQRRATLAPIVSTLVFAVALAGASIMALDHVGIDVATILAGAGILGLAIGFGAQTLVKDCLSGFFMILDNVVSQGDIVEANGVTGTVEAVGLRVTRIRSYSGQLWFVPNGEIASVGNWNRDWVRVIVSVGLAYEQDVRRGLEVLQRVGAKWAAENESIVLEPPEAQGILSFNSSDVGARLVVKIDNRESVMWSAERELNKRVKAAFDEEGVEIPFPRRAITYVETEAKTDTSTGGDGVHQERAGVVRRSSEEVHRN